jgi:hypothetical protein
MRKKPYFTPIGRGLSLGGTWVMRAADGKGGNWTNGDRDCR